MVKCCTCHLLPMETWTCSFNFGNLFLCLQNEDWGNTYPSEAVWFKGDDVLKDVVFNQHIIGAEIVLMTVLVGGHQTQGKGSNRPIKFSLPVRTGFATGGVHWTGSLEVLRCSGLG